MVTRDSLSGWQTWRCWGNMLASNKNTFATAVFSRIIIFVREGKHIVWINVYEKAVWFLFPYMLTWRESSCKEDQLTQLTLATLSAAESATNVNQLIRKIIQSTARTSQDHCVICLSENIYLFFKVLSSGMNKRTVLVHLKISMLNSNVSVNCQLNLWQFRRICVVIILTHEMELNLNHVDYLQVSSRHLCVFVHLLWFTVAKGHLVV